jgi:hypothetical protein
MNATVALDESGILVLAYIENAVSLLFSVGPSPIRFG